MTKLQDLTGKRFGRFVVLERAKTIKGKTMWLCKCDCGNVKTVEAHNLKSGHIKSCGCLNSELVSKRSSKDITGQRFGRLVAKETFINKSGKRAWKCVCDCGNTTTVVTSRLISGRTRSCGCLFKDYIDKAKSKTHGESYTNLYKKYRGMITRCSPTYHGSKNYYGKGIRVCDEWLGDHGYDNFKKWSISNGYEDGKHWTEMTLDRINNDGNYEPSNCRWTTSKQQCNNMSTNVNITYMGKTQTMKQWCEELNLSYGMVKARHQKGIEAPELFAPNSREKSA